jgi:WhiB family redox-sensing transcriptional regulator
MEDWRHQAACLDHDPETFFPTGATGPIWQEVERAKAICAGCPVSAPCLEWALDSGQLAGVWGGLSEQERRWCARRGGSAQPQRTRRAS